MAKQPYYLLLIVFASGLAVMAVEMSASRLLAPYFGTSLYVWTNLIGLTMIALTVGYWWGGRLADKYPRSEVLYWFLFAAGAYIALIPFLANPIMQFAVEAIDTRNISLFVWSLLATLSQFFIPLLILAMTAPFAIRICAKEIKTVGNTSGSIYALSNVGSILGTFIPALLSIPLIGTKRTIILCGIVLMVLAIVGLRKHFLHLAALGAFALLFIGGPIKETYGMIHEEESVYNYIQVIEHTGGIRELRLNEGHATHSLYDPNSIMVGGEWDYFSLLPQLKPDSKKALMIGLAAGTVSRAYGKLYPQIQIDGVEIDPAILRVGREYFAQTPAEQPTLNPIAADGRTWLKRTEKKYDLITIDAYKQPYIPFHLTTREFFQEAKDHLTEGGIVGINVGSPSPSSELLWMIANTMAAVFEHVTVAKMAGTFNYLIIASDAEYDLEALADRTDLPPELQSVAASVRNNVGIVDYHPEQIVFTDDRAPVEFYTEKMIVEYARS